MPGITGIIAHSRAIENTSAIRSMVDCMVHEPFHMSGTYVNDRIGLWAGWVCHQGSFSDCLPVWNEKKDVCLIFSGEDLCDNATINDVKARGHVFDQGNASYLVHSYEENGIRFLEQLNGWFSGILVDFREEKIVLFNDRYGVNRIYYHENRQGFYFSSEAKSLLRVLPGMRQFDLKSLGEFFNCGCVLQNRTLFSGVSLVPGGAAWTFCPGQPARKETYFKKESWENQPVLTGSQYYERLKETWQRILPRYFRPGQQVGLSLTGGVDSRMILAWAPCRPGTLPCYTFGGMYRDCGDVRISRQVAKICQQPHETIPLKNEFFGEFPALAEKAVYVTDGNLDVTGSADLFVHRRIRQIAPVRVTGVYGGEILRRLVVFKPMRTCQGQNHLDPELLRHVRAAAITYAEESEDNKLSFIAFKQAPWHMHARFAVERSQVTIRTPYFDNDLVALAYQAPSDFTDSEPALRLIAEGKPSLRTIGTDRGSVLRAIPGLTQSRRLFQEFTFKAEYVYDYGMPQWLARIDRVLAPPHLERLFLGRHKWYHFRVWYRDKLSKYLQDVLLDPAAINRSYLRDSCLQEMVRNHIKGNRNYTLELHKLLTLEIVNRKLMEQK